MENKQITSFKKASLKDKFKQASLEILSGVAKYEDLIKRTNNFSLKAEKEKNRLSATFKLIDTYQDLMTFNVKHKKAIEEEKQDISKITNEELEELINKEEEKEKNQPIEVDFE